MANGDKSGVYNPFAHPTEYTYPQTSSGGFYEQDRALFQGGSNSVPFSTLPQELTGFDITQFFPNNQPQVSTPAYTANPRLNEMTAIQPIGINPLSVNMQDNIQYASAAPAYNPTTSAAGGEGGFGARFGANLATPQAMAGMATGIGGIVQGLIGRGKRRDAQIAAQGEFDKMRGQYLDLDTSNLRADSENRYMNMENAYEDLTVNRQQAEFERNMFRQQQANMTQGLRGAAGGSGIAGLAQAMANQGQIAAQRAGASIGQQESRNQMYKAQEASKIQFAQRGDDVRVEQAIQAGAEKGRSLDWQKTSTLFGMAQQDLAAKNNAIAQANAALYGGIGSLVGTVGSAAIGGISG